jgi:hypothetical protein
MRRVSLLHRHRPLSDEGGFAVPTVLLAIIAAFGLATAGVIASVNAQHGTVRDQDSKAALAIAEAGVSNALLRFNRIIPSPATSVCQPVGGTTAGADGWCPTHGTGTIDQGAYDYLVRPFAAQGAVPGGLEIVSTGTVSGVTRRVTAAADAITDGFRPFEGLAGVIGLDGITLNNDSEIHADVATNGNIGLNNGSVLDCDFAQVGPGRGYDPFNNPADYCPLSYGTVSLPPVDPADVATNNSNGRICNLDPITGTPCNQAWNPTTLKLQLNPNSAITLGSSGGEFNYAFCQVILNSKSYIHIANGAKVRMYFLSPDSPPCLNQGSPLILSSRAKIDPTGSDATSLAILVVGSDTKATNIEFNADASLFSCEQSFVIYAPRTTVTLNNDTSVCGGVAAKSVVVNEDATVLASNSADEFELPPQAATHYGSPEDFIECSSTPPGPTAAPDAGC